MDFMGRDLREFKASLHTHTTVSDGMFSPSELIRLYAERGYDVLALTDHRKSNPVSSYPSSSMTLISGMELHPPRGPRGIVWHILGLGLPEDFSYPEPQTGQEAVDAVRAAGGLAFCAHPYWCGLTSAEVGALSGIEGIEVYNASARYIGKADSVQGWDELLDAGKHCRVLAVDDTHRACDLFHGFTVILAPDRSAASLLRALRQGDYYASQGPRFHQIRFDGGVLRAEFTPVVSALVMTRKSGTGSYCSFIDGEHREVNSLEWDLSTVRNTYVRIQLRDATGRMAWSNPLWL